jgi:hypothetical protein
MRALVDHEFEVTHMAAIEPTRRRCITIVANGRLARWAFPRHGGAIVGRTKSCFKMASRRFYDLGASTSARTAVISVSAVNGFVSDASAPRRSAVRSIVSPNTPEMTKIFTSG